MLDDLSEKYYRNAIDSFKKGNREQGFAFLNQALEINPSNVKARNELAKILMFSHKYEAAVKHYNYLLKEIHTEANLYFCFAYCMQKLGKYEQALMSYKQALEIKPDFDMALFNTATLYLNNKDYDSAIIEYENLLVVNPDFYQAYINLGMIYNEKGQYDEAKKCMIKALAVEDKDKLAHYNLGLILKFEGDYNKSVDEFVKSAYAGFKLPELDYHIGDCFINMRKFNHAVKAFKEALKKEYSDAIIHYKLGIAYFGQDMYKEASMHVHHFLKNAPNRPESNDAKILLKEISKQMSKIKKD